MKIEDEQVFCCPACRGVLQLVRAQKQADEITNGELRCVNCGHAYPIQRGIPRFVDPDNYATSFGYQWTKFARTQVGGAQKIISKERFDVTTRWPADLRGQRVLEAGCGAGRFSEIALDTGAELYSFDLSAAIDASIDNIKSPELRRRHHTFQGDIYNLPLPHGYFDKIFCLGVLQHCPVVKQAYQSLIPYLKPGGQLVIDCYLSQPLKHAFNLKYLLRPAFKWWPPAALFNFCSAAISVSYDVKAVVTKLPAVGPELARAIPIGRLNYEPEHSFTTSEIKEIKTLSVFDMLSPKYDQCQSVDDFRRWMLESGLEIVSLGTGYNGVNAIGRMPSQHQADRTA